MNAEQRSFVSRLDEEHLYRLAREGYQKCLDDDTGTLDELPFSATGIVLVERHIMVVFPKAWEPTVEVRMDMKSGSNERVGYCALVLEEGFRVQDGFFVIDP